jgi:hypothetical protein
LFSKTLRLEEAEWNSQVDGRVKKDATLVLRMRSRLVTSPVARGKSAVACQTPLRFAARDNSQRLLSAGYASVRLTKQIGLHPFLAYFPYYEIIKVEF